MTIKLTEDERIKYIFPSLIGLSIYQTYLTNKRFYGIVRDNSNQKKELSIYYPEILEIEQINNPFFSLAKLGNIKITTLNKNTFLLINIKKPDYFVKKIKEGIRSYKEKNLLKNYKNKEST